MIAVGANGEGTTVVDSVRVYGKTRDSIGWCEDAETPAARPPLSIDAQVCYSHQYRKQLHGRLQNYIDK